MCHKDKNEFLHPSGTHCVLLAFYCQCFIQSSQKNFYLFFSLFKTFSQENVYQESKKGMDGYIYVALKNINISDIKILIRSCY